MDDEASDSWIDWLEQIREGGGYPTFDQVCQKAKLTDKQTELLSTFSRTAKRTIIKRYTEFCRPRHDGTGSLRGIAEDLEVLFREDVSGPKRRFVKKLFGSHALQKTTETKHGTRICPGSKELYDTLYELDLVTDFVRAGYSVELEPKLSNRKVPEFLARNRNNIYVEAKRLDYDRQMDIVSGDESWPEKMERVRSPREKTLKLEQMVTSNLERARVKFDGVSVSYLICILSLFPPKDLGNAIPAAICKFLNEPNPGLRGVVIDCRKERSFWEVVPEGIKKTVFSSGDLSFL